jgi:hypothetical protein
MKRKISLSITAASCIVVLLCCNNLFAQGENRPVSGFDEVSYSLPGKLIIVQGNTESLVLEGSRNDMERIITVVEGSSLKIYTRQGTRDLGDVTCKITVKELHKLSVAGSGDVVIRPELKTHDFKIALSGSADIRCESVSATSIDLDLAGSGNIDMKGSVNNDLEVSIAGSGNVDASELRAREAEVNIAGSGNARVWATEKLGSNIVGSGSVYYKGNPLVNAETSGSGRTISL